MNVFFLLHRESHEFFVVVDRGELRLMRRQLFLVGLRRDVEIVQTQGPEGRVEL